jgi:hypothetical protein
MKGEPRTLKELLAWFGEGHKAGHYDLRAIQMLHEFGNRDVAYSRKGEEDEWWTLHLWDQILGRTCGSWCTTNPRYFWLTPRGYVYGCGYADHERMLSVMGIQVRDAELAGWCRVSDYAKHVVPLSRAQLDYLASRSSNEYEIKTWDVGERVEMETGRPPRRKPLRTIFDRPIGTPWTVWLPWMADQPLEKLS